MDFQSILYPAPPDGTADAEQEPAYFKDLNLDQIVGDILRCKREYRLEPFFRAPLTDPEAIRYRQEILRELEEQPFLEAVRTFATGMHGMRASLQNAEKLHNRYQKEWWFLDAARRCCEAAQGLCRALARLRPQSRGLASLAAWLEGYVCSERFCKLRADIETVLRDLSSVRTCMRIKDCTVQVRRYDAEADYSAQVLRTFEKFKQAEAKSHLVKFDLPVEMNHVEAGILDFVARLYPAVFAGLDTFCETHADYLEKRIETFDREVQFYVSYLEFIAPLREGGLDFCCPELSRGSKEVLAEGGFDLALASRKLRFDHSLSSIVCNDFRLAGRERILVVSGPNQGGKTTFARMVGQMHFLARLGLPVPGKRARLFLCDRIYTHFERAEDIRDLRGKLQDDLVRMHDILTQATPDSLIIMNEIFSSTTLQDAVLLGKRVLETIIRLDALCVCVTFLDELSTLGDATVSMVGTVDPQDRDKRTFKIIRKPADGLSYAVTIAEKYGLTYEKIKERIK